MRLEAEEKQLVAQIHRIEARQRLGLVRRAAGLE
jgi:hypothetical protein